MLALLLAMLRWLDVELMHEKQEKQKQSRSPRSLAGGIWPREMAETVGDSVAGTTGKESCPGGFVSVLYFLVMSQ